MEKILPKGLLSKMIDETGYKLVWKFNDRRVIGWRLKGVFYIDLGVKVKTKERHEQIQKMEHYIIQTFTKYVKVLDFEVRKSGLYNDGRIPVEVAVKYDLK